MSGLKESDKQEISNAFNNLNLKADSFLVSGDSKAGMLGVSASGVKTGGLPSWDTTEYTNVQFTKKITTISGIGNSATAEVTLSLTGEYRYAGLKSDGSPWEYSGSFVYSGYGTVKFVKEGEIWKVDDIPGLFLKNNEFSPEMTEIDRNPFDVAAGEAVQLSATITSQLPEGKTNRMMLAVSRGFSFLNVGFDISTEDSFTYTDTINTFNNSYPGNHYGAVVAYQLVEDSTDTTAPFKVYFTVNISMFKVH